MGSQISCINSWAVGMSISYKLGKRSILDLLSSEQSFHSSRAERESARYDIYDTLAIYINVIGKSRDIYQLNNTKIQGFEVQ